MPAGKRGCAAHFSRRVTPGRTPGVDIKGIEIAVVGANIDEASRYHGRCKHLRARRETPQQMPMLSVQADQLAAIISHKQLPTGQCHAAAHPVNERLFRFAIERIYPEHVAMYAV